MTSTMTGTLTSSASNTTLRFGNAWHHGEDGKFAPKGVELAASPTQPPVLVGVHVKDGDLPTAGEGMPYMGDVPFLALYEVKNQDPQAVAKVLAGIEFPETSSTVGESYTASNPLRRAVQIDPGPFADTYAAIGQALVDAGLIKSPEKAEYPLVVQLGPVEKAEVRGLKGKELTFAGLVAVTIDGTIVEAETAEAAPVDAAPEGEVAEMAAADTTTEVAETTAAAVKSNGKWEGCLAVEGVSSGDGRTISLGALTWRDLPLPLMIMTQNPVGGEGHDGAQLAGRIEWVERRDGSQPDIQEVWGGGVLDLGCDAGKEAARLLTPDEMGMTFLRGVSVDLDDVSLDMSEGDSDPLDVLLGGKLRVQKARVMGATLTPFPAFQEAQVVLVNESLVSAAGTLGAQDEFMAGALVASVGAPRARVMARTFLPYNGTEHNAIVASGGTPGIPVKPPTEWFAKQEYDAAFPLRIDGRGRITGYAASDGACHIGFPGQCVPPPESPSQYRKFMNKTVECDDGTMVETGVIIMDTVHPSLKAQASDTQSFYAHTGCGVADVRVYRDQHGIQVCGAVRPSVTPVQLRALRGSDVSPDWRAVDGRRDMIGLLAVNTSGFITEALAASAALATSEFGGYVVPGNYAAMVETIDGEPQVVALVASGMLRHEENDTIATLRADLVELRAAVAPIVAQYQADRAARYAHVKDRLGLQSRDERREAAMARLGVGRYAPPAPGRASSREFVQAAARKRFGPSRRARVRAAVDRLVEHGVVPTRFAEVVVSEEPPLDVIEEEGVNEEVTIEGIVAAIEALAAVADDGGSLATAAAEVQASGTEALSEAVTQVQAFIDKVGPEDERVAEAQAILDMIDTLAEDQVPDDEGMMEGEELLV